MNARVFTQKDSTRSQPAARSWDTLRRCPAPASRSPARPSPSSGGARRRPRSSRPPQAVDGPSAAIRELGGVAMSADGTGGIVYRKDDGGRPPHLRRPVRRRSLARAAARRRRGRPGLRLGVAGDRRGRRRAACSSCGRRSSARPTGCTPPRCSPGARRFEAPIPVDLNIGEMSLGTWPSVTMAPGGQAYLVYRVITDAAALERAARVGPRRVPDRPLHGPALVRLRHPGQPQPRERAEHAHRRPIARASASTSSATPWWRGRSATTSSSRACTRGARLRDLHRHRPPGDAVDARRRPGQRGRLAVRAVGRPVRRVRGRVAPGRAGTRVRRRRSPAPRLLVAQSPDEYSPSANVFAEPRAFDGGGADGPGRRHRLGGGRRLRRRGADRVRAGRGRARGRRRRPGGAAAGPRRRRRRLAPTDPVVTLGSSGSAALAWKRNAGGRGGVVVRERRSDGVTSDRRLSGTARRRRR